jgi:hypothetical protein
MKSKTKAKNTAKKAGLLGIARQLAAAFRSLR